MGLRRGKRERGVNVRESELCIVLFKEGRDWIVLCCVVGVWQLNGGGRCQGKVQRV